MDGFEVGIIGAGVHGASAAFHLASTGVRPVIFDRSTPAGGPTGRSSAICRAYYRNDFLAGVARDSIEMFANFERLTGGDAGYRRTGALFLHPPQDEQEVRAGVVRLNELGVVSEVLEPSEISSRFPAIDTSGVGIGAWERDAGYADPAGTTNGLFGRAVELGAQSRMHTSVVAVEADGDSGWTIVSADGTGTPCRRVLIAAGPWTAEFARQVDVELPLTAERHFVASYRWARARPAPLHADLVGDYYLKPEPGDLFVVGSLSPEPEVDPDHFNERITDGELERLSGALIRRIPEMEGAELHGGWASLYDVSPDWQPVIGEIAPGFFVDAGTSGHGFKLAPGLGRHVAQLVMGEGDPGLGQFHPRRFEEGLALAAGYGEARILG